MITHEKLVEKLSKLADIDFWCEQSYEPIKGKEAEKNGVDLN